MLIPIPKHEEPEVVPTREQNYNQIYRYWHDTTNWQCPKCQAVMFGRMEYCIYCKVRLNQETLKP